MKNTLRISFGKSSSKRFKEAVMLAEKLNYTTENNLYIVILSFNDVFNKWEYVNELLHIIDKWSSFEICLNNIVCTTNRDYRRIFYEIQDIKTCYNKTRLNNDYCITTYESGCWRVNNVIFDIHSFESAYKGWYKCGTLIGDSTWKIDKERIYNNISEDARVKNAHLCPFYSLDKLKTFLAESPDTIDVSDKDMWEIEYEDVLTEKGVESRPVTITYLNSDRFTFNHLKDKPVHGFGIRVDMSIGDEEQKEDESEYDNINTEDMSEDEKADLLIDRYLRNKKK